jgi:hypothetical protein
MRMRRVERWELVGWRNSNATGSSTTFVRKPLIQGVRLVIVGAIVMLLIHSVHGLLLLRVILR